MKAVWYEKNGAAADVLTLGEMPADEPEAGELRIRLHASGVNPSDVKNRAGITRKLAFPRQIPDSDGAGVVDKVGPDVAGFAPGDRVWVYNGAFGRPHGTSAEFITLPSHQVAPLPDGLDFAQGACLGIPGMTATAVSLPADRWTVNGCWSRGAPEWSVTMRCSWPNGAARM